MTAVTKSLQKQVYGQHIALDMVSQALEQFMTKDSKRYLVMSFHGWTGIGKTFVSTIISNHIFTPSMHRIIIPLHFPHELEDDVYEQKIKDIVTSSVTSCAVTLFIIEEMDKATPGIILGLEGAIKRIGEMPLNNSRVIIILVSNTGGAAINRYVYRHLENGYSREKLTGSGIVSGILSNDEESVWIRHLHDGVYIDEIVPFLPLEKTHLQACIEAYVRESPYLDRKSIKMARLLDEFSYLPKDNPIFSKTGCRQVNAKVNLMSDIDLKMEL